MRPGQLNLLVLRRVIMGDIAVTAVDLALRGYVSVEESADGWAIRPLRSRFPARGGNRCSGTSACRWTRWCEPRKAGDPWIGVRLRSPSSSQALRRGLQAVGGGVTIVERVFEC